MVGIVEWSIEGDKWEVADWDREQNGQWVFTVSVTVWSEDEGELTTLFLLS